MVKDALYFIGSSPRLWGTLQQERRALIQRRFIPTLVGNAIDKHYPPDATSVHPHACGERTIRRPHSVVTSGSSPRLWGTLLLYIIDLPSNFRPVTGYQTIRLNLYYFVKDHFHRL